MYIKQEQFKIIKEPLHHHHLRSQNVHPKTNAPKN